jgi:hypothetical protein
VTKTRDGKSHGKTKNEQFTDTQASMRAGRAAAHEGSMRMDNPYMYARARAWTFGWEQAHLKIVGGECKGCKLCGERGTKPSKSFKEWLHGREVRPSGWYDKV